MIILEEHTALHPKDDQRLSDYLIGKLSSLPSRKSVKKAILSQAIYLNDKIGSTGDYVKTGDHIKFVAVEKFPANIYEFPMRIVFEDEHLALINKPGGIPVSGNHFRTVYNALGSFLNINPKDNFYPQPVHRLDSATSGLLLIAKTLSTRIALGKLFEERKIKKKYQAIVHGFAAEVGRINLPIDQLKASSSFQTIRHHRTNSGLEFSHLELEPFTGRTHQLRKHCLYMGHPILGDPLYQIPGWQLKKKGMLLCATSLAFTHPVTKVLIEHSIAPPAKFEKLMSKP